ncbi:AIM24 family protein [Acidaminobacter sp. JC074]|uniref:AIM24 family protein n=1 Tax=Acidaminobacter sp. JC074 TaxID=2530199 RepID=UPI001F113106|nr:AIM24 family protein [Acidaminobacter sp. JC074]MCH4889832.1 AIM24 family protein [Acidaminobacter sp. JC074]
MDYKIHGNEVQYLEVNLLKNEKVFGDIKSVVTKDKGIKIHADYHELLDSIIKKDSTQFTEFKNTFDRTRQMIFSVHLCNEIRKLDNKRSYLVDPNRVLCSSHDMETDHDLIHVKDSSIFLYSLGEIQIKQVEADIRLSIDKDALMAMTDSIKIQGEDFKSIVLEGPGHIWLSSHKI